MRRWSVAVVGPGGVGGLVGGVLAREGHAVGFVAPPDTAATLAADGLHVSSAQFGDFHVPAPAASRLDGPVDLCIVAVKATRLEEALDGVPAEVLGSAVVLPLLNGLDHMAVLRERYPAASVLAGAIRVESTRVAPGRIAHTSPFAMIDVAGDRADALAGQLRAAGFEVTVRPDESTLLWDKLALLAPMALLTTSAGGPVGVVRAERGTDLAAVVDEVAAVARAAGAAVDPAAVHAMLARVPADMKSSMQRDVEAGRATELDAIGGAVLRAARTHGVDTPVTARLVAELGAR